MSEVRDYSPASLMTGMTTSLPEFSRDQHSVTYSATFTVSPPLGPGVARLFSGRADLSGGREPALERSIEQRLHQAELYADTPEHLETRQQRKARERRKRN